MLLAKRFSPVVHLLFPQMPTDQFLAYLAGELTGEMVEQPAVHRRPDVRVRPALPVDV